MKSVTPLCAPIEVRLKLSKSENEESIDGIIYRNLVGSLMYLTATRPDLMFAVSMLSRFMESPKKSHWEAGKRVLRYFCGIINEGIHCKRVEDSTLIGYCDVIGAEVLMIAEALLVILFILVQVQSQGHPRSKMLLRFLQQKQSIFHWY